MKLVFATNNKNKLKEVQALLPSSLILQSLDEINCTEEIPETSTTIEANASQKAFYVYEKYHADCFADDTGLEVEFLDGAPGVFSARYAGEEKSAEKNMEKLLAELKNQSNRKAQFKTVISLVINKQEHLFEGIIKGSITNKPIGEKGFGYDPVFMPEGYSTTFADMSLEEKNKISHRALAVQKLVTFLNQHYSK